MNKFPQKKIIIIKVNYLDILETLREFDVTEGDHDIFFLPNGLSGVEDRRRSAPKTVGNQREKPTRELGELCVLLRITREKFFSIIKFIETNDTGILDIQCKVVKKDNKVQEYIK